MKRLLDEVESGPNKRNTRDVNVRRMLPEHISEIASYSLEALVVMAQSETWLMHEVQKEGGALIVNHREWHPWMRPMVANHFADITKGEGLTPALELPLHGGKFTIPWTLLVQNWVRWNEWLLAQPPDLSDNPSDAVKAWTMTFEFFDWHFLARAETKRMQALIRTLFLDMVAAFDENRVAEHLTINGGPTLSYLGLLEVALRVHWQQHGNKLPALELLELLNFPQADAFLNGLGAHVGDARAEAIMGSLREMLPLFYLTVHNLEKRILILIYASWPSEETLAWQLKLPNPLDFAYRKAASTNKKNKITIMPYMCKRLGELATLQFWPNMDLEDETLSKEQWVVWPCFVNLNHGAWLSDYWPAVRAELHGHTNARLPSFGED
jgi:hypothetical protein